ncbi:WbqC family protein, partial [Chryseobacterium sp. 2TAF14]|uniref:WbqC family protein n=1 Tax=Chryseobacterium sp. 2TAF14 TaxID=3233007 RepID=UPI003F929146
IEISYREDWQKLHWKSIKTAYQSSPYFEYYEDKLKKLSIKTAYQSSPYFEYYEDKLKKLFENKEKFLLDFNIKSIQIILDIFKTEKAYSLNKEYIKNPEEVNFREKFSAKTPSEYEMAEYYQTFSD